jgi:[acyl-carrier-protein] S-malonyltransferase
MAKRTVPHARTITVAVPDDLDHLLDFVSQGRTHLMPRHVEGELLFTTERLVVSPAAGVFTPVHGLGHGSSVAVGEVIGHVAGAEVRSAFAGVLQDFIAVEGERLAARQPVAWLRTA